MSNDEFIWAQKYRPQTIDDCVLPQATKESVKQFIKKGEIPHFLFYGTGGIGKTTLAEAIAKELGADLMKINASLENGIDVIRTKITQFASTVSFGGGIKIVLLDEADFLNCLEENESIILSSGEIIKLNQLIQGKKYLVKSFNMTTGLVEDNFAEVVSDTISDDLYEISLSDGTVIRVTGDHPMIILEDGKYVEKLVKDLTPEDKIVQTKNCNISNLLTITSIKKIPAARVINLFVENNNTFLHESGVVVHNCNSAQPALRGFFEEFSSNCRFILTCNFKSRIIEPLYGRCTPIDFAITPAERKELAKQFYGRVLHILQENNIQYDEKVVVELIRKNFPDFRRTLNELQRYSVSGKIDSGVLVNSSDDAYKELFKFLAEKNFAEIRKWITLNIDQGTAPIYRKIDTLSKTYMKPESVPELILILAEYDYKSAFVADQEVCMAAAMVSIMMSCQFL